MVPFFFHLLGSIISNHVALPGDEVYSLLPELHSLQYLN